MREKLSKKIEDEIRDLTSDLDAETREESRFNLYLIEDDEDADLDEPLCELSDSERACIRCPERY